VFCNFADHDVVDDICGLEWCWSFLNYLTKKIVIFSTTVYVCHFSIIFINIEFMVWKKQNKTKTKK
jgi:hypothetical protein